MLRGRETVRMTHISQFFFVSPVKQVLVDLHQLPEENIPDLGEASAGGLHQGLQDGVDVGLDTCPQELLRLGQYESCTPAYRGCKEHG